MSPFLSRKVVKPPYCLSVEWLIQNGMMLSTSSLRNMSLSCFMRRFVIVSSRACSGILLHSAYPVNEAA